MRDTILLAKGNDCGELRYEQIDPQTGEKLAKSIPYRIVRSKRRTCAISIDEKGEVTLRIPLRFSERTARAFAEEKLSWIVQNVEKQKQRMQEKEQREEGMSEQHRQALKKRYVQTAREYFPKRADYYAALLGVHYERIRIAEQKTRWGSCSSRGTLSFNWKLMLAPPRVLDYVVVHELCHLKEMNHSKRFWALVESVLPDYKKERKWLKENGSSLSVAGEIARGEE